MRILKTDKPRPRKVTVGELREGEVFGLTRPLGGMNYFVRGHNAPSASKCYCMSLSPNGGPWPIVWRRNQPVDAVYPNATLILEPEEK